MVFKQTISLQFFYKLTSTNFAWFIFEYFVPYDIGCKQTIAGLSSYGQQHTASGAEILACVISDTIKNASVSTI